MSQCPTQISKAYKSDMAEVIQHRTVVKLQMDDKFDAQELYEAGLFFQPLRALFNKLPPVSKLLLVQIVTDGVFTNYSLFNMGYLCDPVCPDCGESVDTVLHRCFTCPRIEARARLAVGNSTFDNIVSAGDRGLLGTRCLMPQPLTKSRPAATQIIKAINFEAGDEFSDCEVFGDGSCANPSIPELSRSGFALVQVDSEGNLQKAVYGTLPPQYPQDPLAAEYAAFAAAYQLSSRVTYVGDCSEVLRAFGKGPRAAQQGDNPHACVWKQLLREEPDCLARVSSVTKVKAHKSIEQVEAEGGNLKHFHGNAEADRLAKEAVLLHPCFQDDARNYKRDKSSLTQVAYHMVDTLLALHNSRGDNKTKYPRLPAHVVPKGEVVRRQNQYVWNGSFWFCNICFLRTSSPVSLSSSRRNCIGFSPFSDLQIDPRGHNLLLAFADESEFILFCSKCWCYGSVFPRDLTIACRGKPSVEGSSNGFYLRKGVHPRSRRPFSRPFPLHA